MRGLAAAALAVSLLSAGVARAGDDATCQASYVAGQRRYKLEHDLLGGREQLLLCAKTCPDELRASCGRWLTEIEGELPSIVVKALDGEGHDVLDLSMVVDDKPMTGYVDGTPIELNPGEHRVRVNRQAKAPVETTVLLRAGEKLRVVEVWTEPRSTSVATRRPIPTSAVALAGVSAAALVTFGILAVWTTAEYAQTSSCQPDCPATSRDGSFSTKTTIADVSLGIAAASFVGAGVAYLLRPTRAVDAARTGSIHPWLSWGAGGVAWSATF